MKYLMLHDLEEMGLGIDARNHAFDSMTEEDHEHFRDLQTTIRETMVLALLSNGEDKIIALKTVAEFIGAVFTMGMQVAERRNKEDER